MAELPLDRDNSYLGVYAVNVFVRDQDRSLRFYVDQLGFNLAFDVRLQSGQRWVGVAPPHGSAVLTLIAPEPDSDEYKLIGQPTSVAFVAEDVVATYSQWRKRGSSNGVMRLMRNILIGGALLLNSIGPPLPGPHHRLCWPKVTCQLLRFNPT